MTCPFISDLSVHDVDGAEIRDLLGKIWLAKREAARRLSQRIGAVLDSAYLQAMMAAGLNPRRSLQDCGVTMKVTPSERLSAHSSSQINRSLEALIGAKCSSIENWQEPKPLPIAS